MPPQSKSGCEPAQVPWPTDGHFGLRREAQRHAAFRARKMQPNAREEPQRSRGTRMIARNRNLPEEANRSGKTTSFRPNQVVRACSGQSGVALRLPPQSKRLRACASPLANRMPILDCGGMWKNPLSKTGCGLNTPELRRESDECLVASAVFKTAVPDLLRWVGSIPTLSAILKPALPSRDHRRRPRKGRAGLSEPAAERAAAVPSSHPV